MDIVPTPAATPAVPAVPATPAVEDIGFIGFGPTVPVAAVPSAGGIGGPVAAPWAAVTEKKLAGKALYAHNKAVREGKVAKAFRSQKCPELKIEPEPWESDNVTLKTGSVAGVYKPNLKSTTFRSHNTGQPTELSEQFGFVQWVRAWDLTLKFFAVPNGGKRDHTEAAMKVMEGMSRGVPDLWFPQCRRGYAGLVIEMKVTNNPADCVGTWTGTGGWGMPVDEIVIGKSVWRKGVVSEDQKEWLSALSKEGYLACVCHGMQEAMRAVEWYYAK